MDLASIVRSGFAAVPDGVKGPAIFVKKTAGTYDALTGLTGADVVTTVRTQAVQDRAQPKRYADLGLQEKEAITLFCVPDVAGQRPPLGAEVVWGGKTWKVATSDAVAPAGSSVGESVVVSR